LKEKEEEDYGMPKEEFSEGKEYGGRITFSREQGEGRALVLVRAMRVSTTSGGRSGITPPSFEATAIYQWCEAIVAGCSKFARVLEICVVPPQSGLEWEQTDAQLESALADRGLRHCPIIGIGESALIVHHFAVFRPKICQSIILIDPVFQLAVTRFTRLINWVEQILPLGLPLRVGTDSFISAPFLHRIRCPTLVINSGKEGVEQEEAISSMTRRIPNGWFRRLGREAPEADLIESISSFLPVRHRYPMRRLAA